QYYFPGDEMADTYLTETLHAKLIRAGLDTAGVTVRFDENYTSPKTKLVSYRDLKIKATFCPVIITGSPEAIAFAWQVGVGNSTGIGFGALR
ncbi:MAG TPA: CRISPR-associated endoribonuclease Cas6, partial [Saprospiraceae bacterium]|nr:CRISPR-associated endoribonuclease Cas6 [Saprospiraceae bacterium]